MSTKSQRRSEAVAHRNRASEVAAARLRRHRFLLWGGVAAVVVIAVVVSLVVSSGGDNASTTKFETANVTANDTALPRYDSASYANNQKDPAIGMTLPTLHGHSIFDGKPITIGPDGKPQAVVFVAHWCPHCQAEVPRLVALAKDGVFKGLEVTAVATGTNSAYPNYPPSAWLKRVGWPFPVMADSASQAAANAYGLPAYPYFMLVDANGKVAGRGTGEVSDADIKANVKALLAGTPLPLLSPGSSSSL